MELWQKIQIMLTEMSYKEYHDYANSMDCEQIEHTLTREEMAVAIMKLMEKGANI